MYKYQIQDNKNKIIGAQIQSRHSKNTKYRIFIEYLPNTDGYSSIIGNNFMGQVIKVVFFLN